jgi:hypothetical protein
LERYGFWFSLCFSDHTLQRASACTNQFFWRANVEWRYCLFANVYLSDFGCSLLTWSAQPSTAAAAANTTASANATAAANATAKAVTTATSDAATAANAATAASLHRTAASYRLGLTTAIGQ